MSEPFVYTPSTSYPSALPPVSSPYPHFDYSSAYYPTYPTVPTTHSPFIPQAGLPATGSPYGSPYRFPGTPLPPTSPYLQPNTPTHSSVAFPTSDGGWGGVAAGDAVGSTWNQRPRRPSWAGTALDPQTSAFPAFLGTEGGDFYRDRRHSFNASSPYTSHLGPAGFVPGSPYTIPTSPYTSPSAQPWPNFAPPSPSFHAGGGLSIHPFLAVGPSGPRPDFIFDLSLPIFLPRRLISASAASREVVPITQPELAQPATWPGMKAMRLLFEGLEQWPVDIKLPSSSPFGMGAEDAPPISLGDVLLSIHTAFHTRISHLDWAKLTLSQETAVTKAYSRRCKSYGPEREHTERAQGVKRVDFLVGKVWVRGIVPIGGVPGVFRVVLG